MYVLKQDLVLYGKHTLLSTGFKNDQLINAAQKSYELHLYNLVSTIKVASEFSEDR